MTSLTDRLRQHAQLHQQCTVQDDEQLMFAEDLLAAAAEIERLREQVRVLREACATFVEWLRREDVGFVAAGNSRETPEGEELWREWYHENLRICDLSQTQARAALKETK